MKSKMYDKIKIWYDRGLWTAQMVHDAVEKGLITEEEYIEITQSNKWL